MINVTGLTKYYGEHIALRDVNFEIREGECVGFLGRNGAGKSTVNIGDQYIKVSVPSIVWVVSRLLDLDDTVPHVVLHQMGTSNRKITLSVIGLQDLSIYKRV